MSFGGIVGGILSPLAPAARVAADVYGAKEAAKATERAEKRAFLLEQQRLASSGQPEVKSTPISPLIFLGGGAALLLVVFLLARR